MSTLTQEGIAARKAGDRETARQKLRAALEFDECDVQAWLWLSATVETDQEQLICLQQVLRLDPTNDAAARGLAKLVARGRVTVQPVAYQAGTPSGLEAEPVVLPISTEVKMGVVEVKPPTHRSTAQRPQEKVVFQVKPSLLPTIFTGGFIFVVIAITSYIFNQVEPILGFLFGLFLSLFTLIRLSAVIIRLLFNNYLLTNRNLIVQTGILSRNRKTIPIHKIQDVAYRQSFIERLFSIGDVIVESAGERGAIHLVDLDQCQQRTDQILRLVQQD